MVSRAAHPFTITLFHTNMKGVWYNYYSFPDSFSRILITSVATVTVNHVLRRQQTYHDATAPPGRLLPLKLIGSKLSDAYGHSRKLE